MARTKKTSNIGVDVKIPSKECNDSKCPFHGSVRVRGRVIVGTIIATDVHRTATIEILRVRPVKKYERYERKKTKIRVHNPSCINAEIGDKVKTMECRPISKSKKFVIIEVLGEDIIFKQKKEGIDSSKTRKEKRPKETDAEKDTKESKEQKKAKKQKSKDIQEEEIIEEGETE